MEVGQGLIRDMVVGWGQDESSVHHGFSQSVVHQGVDGFLSCWL